MYLTRQCSKIIVFIVLVTCVDSTDSSTCKGAACTFRHDFQDNLLKHDCAISWYDGTRFIIMYKIGAVRHFNESEASWYFDIVVDMFVIYYSCVWDWCNNYTMAMPYIEAVKFHYNVSRWMEISQVYVENATLRVTYTSTTSVETTTLTPSTLVTGVSSTTMLVNGQINLRMNLALIYIGLFQVSSIFCFEL